MFCVFIVFVLRENGQVEGVKQKKDSHGKVAKGVRFCANHVTGMYQRSMENKRKIRTDQNGEEKIVSKYDGYVNNERNKRNVEQKGE